MVARQIGEGAGRNAHAVETMLVEPVRGGFQREMADALSRQPVEGAMQLDRIGRGQRAVALALGRDHADGADAGGLQAERGPDLAREGGNRRLAAGAGDTGDGSGLTRKKLRRRERQRAAGIGDRHEGNAVGEALGTLLGRHRHRAGRRGGAREMGAVGLGAGDGEEQKTGLGLAAVGGDAGDLERRKPRIEASILKEIGEVHQRRLGTRLASVVPYAVSGFRSPWLGSVERPWADRNAAQDRAAGQRARSPCPRSGRRSSRRWRSRGFP